MGIRLLLGAFGNDVELEYLGGKFFFIQTFLDVTDEPKASCMHKANLTVNVRTKIIEIAFVAVQSNRRQNPKEIKSQCFKSSSCSWVDIISEYDPDILYVKNKKAF